MAEVQLALQRGPAGFEKLVVVKLVHENLASQRDFVEMLLDEARVAALVKHPNVVDIYDLGEAEGRFFIAMEYLEGEPLLAVLRAGREGKRLDVMSTARLISDTAEGLDAAHELRSMAGDPLELVHHDVSLGNIVVLYNGQVKLVDFGVAKATQSVSSRARVQGKFSYMAPEKLRGGAGDRRSDIWSLGCVLWEALTLKRLFKGGNDSDTMKQVLESTIPPPSKVNSAVLVDFDAVVMKALERDADRRYATAKEMASDLEEVLRKQGYGGKNDLIAKYMQATFGDHIAARKKLLQEVSSKGRASADVLQAAFTDGAPGSPLLSGEFSVKFKQTAEMPAEGTPQRGDGTPSRSSSGTTPPRNRSQRLSVPPPIAEITVVEGVRLPDRRPLYIAGGIAALLLTIIVVALAVGGSKDEGRAAAVPLDAAVAIVEDAAVPGDAAVEIDAGEIEIEIDVADAAGSADAKPGTGSGQLRRPAAERPDAAALAKAGIQAFVRGDTKTALQTFKRAQAANPSYAPTWRGLGMVHEKLGNSGAAKAAFQRYLILAPNASDAAQIRTRMGTL
ncbi:MAG: protein kinase [Deltaproteobacteria bacterium]|nr:protein kinase [Deltaproteobacteria bacterium]